mgnify:CR=1 FL=1
MNDPSYFPSALSGAGTTVLMYISTVDRTSPAELVIAAGGFHWPVVTMALAAIGVVAARPLSKKGVPPLSLAMNILVTIVMLIVAELWVIELRPGLLYSFVVALGLGFTGYSLLELLGEELKSYLKRLFAALPIPSLKAGKAHPTEPTDTAEDNVP